MLAADRPDLDPLSDRYVPRPAGARRPTMDDDHRGIDADTPVVEADHLGTGARLGGSGDYDNDYLPGRGGTNTGQR